MKEKAKETVAADEQAVIADEGITAEEESEFLTAPPNKLVAKYSRITMQGMIAQCVMVIVEGLVMGRGLGAHALACVAIVMSVHYLNLAFGNLYGTGVSTLVGNRLGAGDKAGAKHAFSQGFWITLYTGIILMLVFEIFTLPLVTAFGATPEIIDDTIVCCQVFALWLPFSILGQMLTSAMRVDGKPQQSANIITAASVIAPAFLVLATFVFHWGIPAAGFYYGSSLGLWVFAIVYFTRKRSALNVSVKDAKLDWSVCGQIIKIGIPFFLVQLGTFVFNTVTNNLLGLFGGDNATNWIAAFSVISAFLFYFLLMIAQGFSYGMQPIAAYNFGAKQWGRLKQILRASLVYQIVCIALISLVFWIFAYPVCAFFNPEVAGLASQAVRIAIIAACLGYTSMLMATYFQAVNKVVLSTVLSLSRYVIFSAPLMYLMGSAMGINGMWWALVLADTLTGILCLGCAAWEFKRLDKLEKGQGKVEAQEEERTSAGSNALKAEQA